MRYSVWILFFVRIAAFGPCRHFLMVNLAQLRFGPILFVVKSPPPSSAVARKLIVGPRGVHASAPLWSTNEDEHAMPRSAFPPSFAQDLLERDRSLMSKAPHLWNTPTEVPCPTSTRRPPFFKIYFWLFHHRDGIFFLSHFFLNNIYTHHRNYFSAIYHYGAICQQSRCYF